MSTPIALPTVETYASMMKKLRVRCGVHETLGNVPALEDILQEANEYVYRQLDNGLPMRSTLTVAANAGEYEFVSDDSVPIARGSVQGLWIEQGDSERVPLPQGITQGDRAYHDLRAIPERWDTSYVDGVFTLELWPTPDQTYLLHVEHNRVLTRFSVPADKPSAPARLVLGYAIAMGKAHYGRPDADTVGQSFKTMLYNEKVKNKENRRFIPPTACEPSQPHVVATAGGYRQVR